MSGDIFGCHDQGAPGMEQDEAGRAAERPAVHRVTPPAKGCPLLFPTHRFTRRVDSS